MEAPNFTLSLLPLRHFDSLRMFLSEMHGHIFVFSLVLDSYLSCSLSELPRRLSLLGCTFIQERFNWLVNHVQPIVNIKWEHFWPDKVSENQLIPFTPLQTRKQRPIVGKLILQQLYNTRYRIRIRTFWFPDFTFLPLWIWLVFFLICYGLFELKLKIFSRIDLTEQRLHHADKELLFSKY